MDVPAVYVLVYIYNVRLVAISHFLHILLCQLRELSICQTVIQRGVQRDVQYGLLRIPIGKQVILERPHRLSHDLFRGTGDIGNHAVPVNNPCSGVVHFLLVIDDRPVKGNAPVDFRYHVIPPPFSF